MRNYFLSAQLSALLILLGGCQSPRVFLLHPASAAAAVAREPLAPAPQPAASQEPILNAELPSDLPVASSLNRHSTLVTSQRPAKGEMAAPATQLLVSSTSEAAPDTSLVRPVADTPLHKIKETDSFTIVVRVIGVLILLLGVGLIITAFSATFPGWGALAYLLYGLLALTVSIPLLTFRGKNSPRRQELERRRAARKAAKRQ